MRLRTPLIIFGLVLALIVAVGIFLVVTVARGTPVQLPVALVDIPPGTALDPQLFRLEDDIRGLDPETLDAYVTADEFSQYLGYPVVEMVHAGFPVGKAQVRTDDPNLLQSRLTLLLSDESHLVYPLPVTADQAGNYLVAGDRIDVIFTLGRVAAQEMSHVEEVEGPDLRTTPTPTGTLVVASQGRVGEVVTTTVQLPVAKVILPDVLVLRVEREQIRSASASYGMTGAEETRPRTVEGDVLRIYLEVDREQAEVLSFALHNGALNLPARAVPVGGESEGFVWDDFVELFFRGRQEEE